jgi:HEAT repeat protein
VVALYELAPDGKTIAERWLEKPLNERMYWRIPGEQLVARARVLGAMGRTSAEGECLTRYYLERIDRMIADSDPRQDSLIDYLEEWFELLGRLGPGARLAIPRLNEFRNHPNPWIRMYAAEALEQIVKAPSFKVHETPAKK